MLNSYFFPYFWYPAIPHMNEKPPTVYSLLESIVNYGEDEKTKIKDLASAGRGTFFNFDYDLSQHITKEKFETMILNHFLMRRIGFDTLTAFRIQLNVKINEIMPLYNKMFDSLQNWNILEDGKTITKSGTNVDNNTTSSQSSNSLTNNASNNTNNTSDRRKSDTPQNQLSDVRNGNYVTEYNYDTNNTTSQDASTSTGSSSSSGTDNRQNAYNEQIVETAGNKIEIYKQLQQDINSIFSMIFNDLECLFYQLI